MSARGRWALLRAGRYPAAVEQLTRAAALQPEAPVTWLLLAVAHHRRGEAGEARRWLDRASDWAAKNRDRSGASPPLENLPWAERLVLVRLIQEARELMPGPGASGGK